VKYKRADAQADHYQALAYAKGLRVSSVALLYPEDGEVAPATHQVANDDVKILVRTLPVGTSGQGFSDLENRVRTAVRAILAELMSAPQLVGAAKWSVQTLVLDGKFSLLGNCGY